MQTDRQNEITTYIYIDFVLLKFQEKKTFPFSVYRRHKDLSQLDNEINRKIDVTAIHLLLVQNRHQTHDLTLIGSGANELGIQR